MAKFFYKMQNILTIKYKLEEQAKIEYSVVRTKLNEEESKLAKLRLRRDEYEESLRNQMLSELDIKKIKQCEDALEIIKVTINYQIIVVKQVEEELERARIKLKEVMVDRKTHEKLRENAFYEFKKEINADEQKEINEIVSFQYNKTTDSEDDT